MNVHRHVVLLSAVDGKGQRKFDTLLLPPAVDRVVDHIRHRRIALFDDLHPGTIVIVAIGGPEGPAEAAAFNLGVEIEFVVRQLERRSPQPEPTGADGTGAVGPSHWPPR